MSRACDDAGVKIDENYIERMKIMRRWMAGMLAAAVCMTMTGGLNAEAAAKPKLSKASLSLTGKGTSKTLKVKKASGAKLTWKSSNKKVATVKKSGKYGAKVTAKAKGKAVVSCKVKKGKKTYTLKCKVTVKTKAISQPKSTPIVNTTPTQTAAPTVQAPTTAPTATPGDQSGTGTPDLTSDSILQRYNGIFTYMGSSLNYDGWRGNKDLQDAATLNFVKKHFNSFTLEDEMKPDTVLGGGWEGPTMLSVDEARARGYIIPDNYTDSQVPQLKFEVLDKVLEAAHKNGLKMRAHTLMWHQQTPSWFFTARMTNGGKNATPETMDGRLEFYVRTVMKHMMDKEKQLTGENGSIIYAWDVVNEYVHRDNQPSSKSWADVYGDMGLQPTYVKKAFELAYDMLKQYGVQDKVVLFNNDYDTYFCADDIVSLVNFINEGEETKICRGIGMQTHVDIGRPTLAEYGAALDKFLATGLEVQITEMDVTINYSFEDETFVYKDKGETDQDQAKFVGDLMRLIVTKHKNRNTSVNPKGVTGVTIWGLIDAMSWRKEMKPLLFGSSINDPKPSFYSFLDAAKAWTEN